MCGISCIFSSCCPNQDYQSASEFLKLKDNINKRGPDQQANLTLNLSHIEGHIEFFSGVLWLQGKTITEQPVESEKSVFLFNGDIFDGIFSEESRAEHGDTKLLQDALENTDDIINILMKTQGPYAFIYFDKIKQKLYFGRDIYGRRSLLVGHQAGKDHATNKDCYFIITSVANMKVNYNFIELPPLGIFCFDMKTSELCLLQWPFIDNSSEAFQKDNKIRELKKFFNRDIIIKLSQYKSEIIKPFVKPTEQDLDILKKLSDLNTDGAFITLLKEQTWQKHILKLKELLEKSVEKRVRTQPPYCKLCITEKRNCKHALISVLFSGGIDCSILALLVDKYTDKDRPIDLLNVAFEKSPNYKTPDRITGLQTLEELKKLRPERNWNFCEINVPTKELMKERAVISDLIYPLFTILDESLGSALWFAARGQSQSTSRIVIAGMGADELFGGYTKHRRAYEHSGWQALYDSLVQDWENLPHRNFGRDDRVISDHGKQLRIPYMDENVVQFVRNLDVWNKTCPTKYLQVGFGEKILLRSLGYLLGLKNAACLKKRALQFGCRIANPKENGNDVSKHLIKDFNNIL